MKQAFRRLFFDSSKKISKYNRYLKFFSQTKITSLETYSYYISKYIVEDIRCFIKWREKGIPRRYSDAVLRNLCEQIIEYKYLCKNPKLINDFFGKNIKILGNEDPIDAYKKYLGERRINGARKTSKKAKAIGSFEDKKFSDGDNLSLYRMYEILSTKFHHSYYNQICKDIVDRHIYYRIVGISDEKIQDEEDYLMLIFLINEFMNSYKKVIKKSIKSR